MRRTRVGATALLVAALVTGLALSLGLWGEWTASAQDTFTVNGDTSPAEGGCDTPDFETEDIQDAIDSALVADGDTLVICPGSYSAGAGLVTQVNKELTIEGLATAAREDVVVEGSGAGGLVVSVDGVTIRHMKLVASVADVHGITIGSGTRNNAVQDVEVTAWAAGVRIDDAEGNIVETSDIHDNERGVWAKNGADNVIQNNQINDNSATGVFLEGEDQMLVDGNSLSGNGLAQMQIIGRTTATIVRNTIDTASDGIDIGDVPAEALIKIGGSADMANTFTGAFGAPDFYVEMICAAESTVDATYNWWGSTNRTDIANRIFNDEDTIAECAAPDDMKGAVVFHPWATGPAPTPTPAATATPTATATGTPTPTATPGATRTIDLSPPGWHDLAWSGPNATDPATALACISGDYSIAYAWEGPTAGFRRHVDGCAIPGICNMAPLNRYDTLLVNITAADVSCTMPVTP